MPRTAAVPPRRVAVLIAVMVVACVRPVATPSAPASGTVVPIQLVNNHVHLRMRSGGRDLSLIYDTGAGFTLLDIPVAEALGFKLGKAVNVGGAGANPVRAFAIEGGRLVLPQDSSIRVTPVVGLQMALASFEGIPVHGILGADFTRQSVLQLDYANRRMVLHPRDFRYAGNGIRIPLTFREGQPHTVAQVVLADSARLSANCVIDVGASAALILTKPFVEKHRLLDRVAPTIRRQSGRGVGGSSWATLGRVVRLQLGSAELKAPVTAMYGDSAGVLSTDRAFECNIGGDILRRFVVYFDYRRREMILEPTSAVSDPFEADMSGAAFRIDTIAKGIRALDLMPRGPAATAGLREDDLILSIDGRPALEYGMEALRRRLRRPGGQVEFRVRRGEGEQIIQLPVQRLI